MPIHHISIYFPESKFDAIVSFYLAALAPLGYKQLLRHGSQVVGLGVQYPDFWLHSNEDSIPRQRVHVAFNAESTELVDAFYAAAIAAGGVDNGPPGPRPEYGPGFYGAFVLDATGNNIEACHIE